MITAKENNSGCFQASEVAKGLATPSSVAIASRKRNQNIPEVFCLNAGKFHWRCGSSERKCQSGRICASISKIGA